MTHIRFLHVGPEDGPHANFRDLWMPASEAQGTSAWESVDVRLPLVELQAKVDFLLKRDRPRVLVTHWEGAERILPWVTYRRSVRLVCHRYSVRPMPLRMAHRMLYSMVRTFVVPQGGLVEFVRAAGVDDSRIEAFPMCPSGLQMQEPKGIVLGILPAASAKILKVRTYVEKRHPQVTILEGTAEELIPIASILLDLGEGLEVQRSYLDALAAGRCVLVPDSDLFRSLYGNRVRYFRWEQLLPQLRDLFIELPSSEKIDCAGREAAVESIGSAYRRAAA